MSSSTNLLAMWITSLLIYLLIATGTSCTVNPSPDFDLQDAVGFWNVAAFFTTHPGYEISFYTKTSLNLSLEAFDTVQFSFEYRNPLIYDQINGTLVTDPFNNGILISRNSPSVENNFVVPYYNKNSGEAVAINFACTFGVALSRNDNPYHNNFSSTITEIFTYLNLPLSNLTLIFNNNWDPQGLVPVNQTFSSGMYYGNAIFTTNPALQDLQCFELLISCTPTIVNFSVNYTYSTNHSNLTSFDFIPYLTTNLLVSDQFENFGPLVVIYANSLSSSSNLFAVASAQRDFGFIFSKEPPSQVDLTSAKQAFIQNGLIINSTNFYEMSTVCGFGSTNTEVMSF